MRSYDKIYLEHASVNIGTMFQYAVSCEYDPKMFWDMFCTSNISKEIEKGNPIYLVGHSAIDLFNYVINESEYITPECFYIPNEYYWAGWVLAQYQNFRNISFFDINRDFPIEKVLSLYNTLHEADITKFYDIADEFIYNNKRETNLKRIRKAAGLSQSELAVKSGVSIRNIQMYEQRNNDINKAQVDILLKLSKTLGCNIEDLLEYRNFCHK